MVFKIRSTGKKFPTDSCRYLARDGLYYTGYLESPDYLEDKKKNVPRGTK